MKSDIKMIVFILKSLYIGLFMPIFKPYFVQMGTFLISNCSKLNPINGDFLKNKLGTNKVPFIFQNVGIKTLLKNYKKSIY